MTQPPVDPTGQPDSSWDDDLPDPVEPAEDDLWGWWPGDDCGPPVDVDAWLAKLSPAQRDAVFEGGAAVVREDDSETKTESECSVFVVAVALDELRAGPSMPAVPQSRI